MLRPSRWSAWFLCEDASHLHTRSRVVTAGWAATLVTRLGHHPGHEAGPLWLGSAWGSVCSQQHTVFAATAPRERGTLSCLLLTWVQVCIHMYTRTHTRMCVLQPATQAV